MSPFRIWLYVSKNASLRSTSQVPSYNLWEDVTKDVAEDVVEFRTQNAEKAREATVILQAVGLLTVCQ